jgi:hypothetical protein
MDKSTYRGYLIYVVSDDWSWSFIARPASCDLPILCKPTSGLHGSREAVSRKQKDALIGYWGSRKRAEKEAERAGGGLARLTPPKMSGTGGQISTGGRVNSRWLQVRDLNPHFVAG